MADEINCIACSQTAEAFRNRHPLVYVRCPRCGDWEFSEFEGKVAQAPLPRKPYLLSAWLRSRWDQTGQPFLFADRREGRLPEPAVDLTVPGKMDRALLLLADRTAQCGNSVDISVVNDYPLVWAHNSQEFSHLLTYLLNRKLIDDFLDLRHGNIRCRVTMEGWTEVAKLRQAGPNARQAFVAMWFHQDLNAAYEDGIKPALVAARYDPYRVDRRHSPDKIDDHAMAQIRRSGLVIADCTGLRSSVLFEAGFAMGLNIPVVWTCKADALKQVEELAFDVRQYPFVVWNDPAELRSKLLDKVEATHPRPAS